MKEEISQIKNLFLRTMGHTVAYLPRLAPHVGGATPTLFLSQLIYWADKGEDSEGWIWKMREEWEAETGLTRYEQETARKKLKERGILEEQQRGIHRVLYYRVNWEALWVAATGEKPSLDAQRGKSPRCNGEQPMERGKSLSSIGGFSPDGKEEKPPLYTSENTSENTKDLSQKEKEREVAALPPEVVAWYTSRGLEQYLSRDPALLQDAYRSCRSDEGQENFPGVPRRVLAVLSGKFIVPAEETRQAAPSGQEWVFCVSCLGQFPQPHTCLKGKENADV